MNFIGPSTSVAFIVRKGLIERIVQYLKDKRELRVPMITNYPCIIEVCELEYVYSKDPTAKTISMPVNP